MATRKAYILKINDIIRYKGTTIQQINTFLDNFQLQEEDCAKIYYDPPYKDLVLVKTRNSNNIDIFN